MVGQLNAYYDVLRAKYCTVCVSGCVCCLVFWSINVHKHPYTLALHARLTLPSFLTVASCRRGEEGLKDVNPDYYQDDLASAG